MHFDTYVRERNTPNIFTKNQQFPAQTIDPNQIITPLRPPPIQSNFIFNKNSTVYHQNRPETNRPNSSTYRYNYESNKGYEQPKSIARPPYQYRPDLPKSNNYIHFGTNYSQMPEEKNTFSKSPIKTNNRTSAGLSSEEVQPFRTDFRRSQSILNTKPPQQYQQNFSHFGSSLYRQTAENFSHLNSENFFGISTHCLSNLTPSVTSTDASGIIIAKKDLAEPFSLTFKEDILRDRQYKEAQNDQTSTKCINKDFQDTKTNYRELGIQKNKKDKLTPSVTLHQDSIIKNSSLSQESDKNKEIHFQPLDRRYSHNQNLDNIEKDIEMLKEAAKQTDKLYEKEFVKNTYVNKFMEQRGIKASETQKQQHMRQKNSLQVKLIILQKDVEDKSKEIIQKTKEICDKSKIIIEKNQIVDSLKTQLKDKSQKIQDIQMIWVQQQNDYLSMIEALKQQNICFKNQFLKKSNLLKKQMENMESTHNYIVADLNQNVQRFQKKNIQLQFEASNLTQKLEILEQKNKKYQLQFSSLKAEIQSYNKKNILLNSELQQKINEINQKDNLISNINSQINIQLQQTSEKSNEQNKGNISKVFSFQEIVSNLQTKNAELTSKVIDFQEKYSQIACLLEVIENYDQKIIIDKINDLKSQSIIVQALLIKEKQRLQQQQLQRLQQQHFEKKYQQMNREIKRLGIKYSAACIDIQQGWKQLRDLNNEIVLLNLLNLNEKYQNASHLEQ